MSKPPRWRDLSWPMAWTWRYWLAVNGARGGYVLATLAIKPRGIIPITVAVLAWEAGKIAEKLAEPHEGGAAE